MASDFSVDDTGVEARHPSGFVYSVFPSWLKARQREATVADYPGIFKKFRKLAEDEALRAHQAGEDPVILSDPHVVVATR